MSKVRYYHIKTRSCECLKVGHIQADYSKTMISQLLSECSINMYIFVLATDSLVTVINRQSNASIRWTWIAMKLLIFLILACLAICFAKTKKDQEQIFGYETKTVLGTKQAEAKSTILFVQTVIFNYPEVNFSVNLIGLTIW